MMNSYVYAKDATAMYRAVVKTKNEKRVALQSNFVFRSDAAKRITVCCTVFRFLTYIRKTMIVCL